MDREKKRMIALSVIIVSAIAISIAYSIWLSLFSKSAMVFSGEAPFSVEIFGEQTVACLESPCEIESKNGVKTVIATKEGYKQILTTVDIPARETVEIKLEFEIIPFVTSAENFPEAPSIPAHKLIIDESRQIQKLVEEGDDLERAIVYFQKELKNSKIFSGKSAALIISDEGIYKVNISAKSRELIEAELGDVKAGIWSESGKYFLYSSEDSTNLKVLTNEQELEELALYSENNAYVWTMSDSILFITEQDINSIERIGNYYNYIEVLPTISLGSYSFIEYHPEENSYTKIETITTIPERPSVLIPTSNLKVIYFRSGEENYQLNRFL